MSYQEALEELLEKYFPMNQIVALLDQITEDIESLPLNVSDLVWLLEEKIRDVELEVNNTSVLDFEGQDALENIDSDERPFLIWEVSLDTWWIYVTLSPDCIWFYVTDIESVFEEVED